MMGARRVKLVIDKDADLGSGRARRGSWAMGATPVVVNGRGLQRAPGPLASLPRTNEQEAPIAGVAGVAGVAVFDCG